MTFQPNEKLQLVTTGANHWRFWKIQEGTLKLLNKIQCNQAHMYTEHCWLSNDRLVACSKEGEMYILDRAEERIIQSEDSAFKQDDQTHVTSIARYSKGFLLCSNTGEMALWVRSDENNSTSGKNHYDFIRKWQPASTKSRHILGCSVGNGEEYLAICMDNNNIGLLNIKSIGLNEDLNREIVFNLILKGFHSSAITCIDVAVQRPMLITASKDDSTVRLWNYQTGMCELAREYYVLEDAAIRAQAKPLVSVAMHPSGYQCAISFVDKILIHHILHDELRVSATVDLRNAYLIKYSTGGQYFFAVERTTVHIYNAYTMQKLKMQSI